MNQITKMPKIAFVIVGWNNRDILEECIESILGQSYQNIKIIFVDNESKDDSVKIVNKKFPTVKVLQQKSNLGFARANNIGINFALEDKDVGYVALLNTDARIDRQWAERIVSFAGRKPKGAFFQGTTFDYYDHQIIDSTHIYVSTNGQGTQGGWRHYSAKEFGPKKVFGVNAAACIISRKFIEEQPFKEFFDTTLFMYLEDVDVSTRATVLGWDSYLVPKAKAYHMGSVSSGKNPGFSLYMTFRNNSGVLLKNMPLIIIWRMLPKLIRGDIDTLRTLHRRDQKPAMFKVVKGRFISLLRLPLFIGKRIVMMRHKKVDTEYLWKLMQKGY